MTSQVTNSREVGFTSCCGRSQKLCAFTSKELETVRVAQKLLGAPTIGGGSAWAGGGGGGSQRSQICPNTPPWHPECKMAKNRRSFAHFLANKSLKMQFFAQKYCSRQCRNQV
jgi:hypothetical protein